MHSQILHYRLVLLYTVCSHYGGSCVYHGYIWQLIKDLHNVTLNFICILPMEYMLIQEIQG